ncbi:MAG: methylmalonyl Co-A mutase-associated GTPase MeaB [Anaerolineales bacterium]|jgi:LAO/AO transport system kinase|uniref:methylmalonyl Co-A mutase-associated GTPase MeaB n=1 Tax=Candidatus Villigracilis vicinus TaxID=3140679 RepID=UPI003136230A|nr:methylmalonyl Co-A mutase-associated GTPase MeaB [Anaerolineales bacterium]
MTSSQAILNGDRLALARLLTQVENNSQEGRSSLMELFPHTGKAHLIGVTGAPGTGKSSLVNQLALHYRKNENKRIAIVAIDPSSPFTGGAVLGDRVRMRDLSGDPNVFIRSMASRGSLGGLAQATANVVQVFDAAGFDIVIVETVGAGQSEVDIARLAHTTLVVEAPGLGDDIQAIKAGILEIADILVVNKADRPGVENTEKALKSMLELAHPTERVFKHHGVSMKVEAPKQKPTTAMWIPPIQRTVSTEGTGVPELVNAIGRHVAHLRLSGDWSLRERTRLEVELEALIRDGLMNQFRDSITTQQYEETMESVMQRKISPWEAASTLMNGRKP